MPAFIFLGGPECGVDSVCMFGVTLPVGVPVEVAEANAVQKLRGNMFFREVEADAPTEEPKPAEEPRRRGRPPRV